jgi:hypothetical protein
MPDMPDSSPCDHEWVDDAALETYPPTFVSHCVTCGLRRHVKGGSGEIAYYPPPARAHPARSVSSPPPDEPPPTD